MSCSLDDTLKLWDFRHPSSVGTLSFVGPTVASYDPEGIIFAVGIRTQKIKLYDMRKINKEPFSEFIIQIEATNTRADWSNLQFSPNGRYILISTNGAIIRLIDSETGRFLHNFIGQADLDCDKIEASFTPDSKFVICGSAGGVLHIWSVLLGNKVAELDSGNTNTIQFSKVNDRALMLASTCKQMLFWLPDLSRLG